MCVCARLAQLRSEQPSYLKGDNFFKFVCCDCSEDGKESFDRMRLTWQQVGSADPVTSQSGSDSQPAHTQRWRRRALKEFVVLQVVMLAMYNLSLEGTGRQGYFRWKEDICAFIGRHWNFLLGSRSEFIPQVSANKARSRF